MNDFVNQIKTKDGSLYDIQDKNINVDNGKLFVSQIKTPQPVAEFDGVKYYHKHEFDLEELLVDSNRGKYYDVLSGEEKTTEILQAVFVIYQSYGPYGTSLSILNRLHTRDETLLVKTTEGSYEYYSGVNKAYVINTTSQDPASAGVNLPNCTAFYISVSDETKILTTYWNEKNDVQPITKITDGTNEVEIHDNRVDNLSSGTKLYKHMLVIDPNAQYPKRCEIISNNPSAVTIGDYHGEKGLNVLGFISQLPMVSTEIKDNVTYMADSKLIKLDGNLFWFVTLYIGEDKCTSQVGTILSSDSTLTDTVIEL